MFVDNQLDSYFDRRKVNDAIAFICNYFDEGGFTLYERWHVCNSIEKAAHVIMAEKYDAESSAG